VIFAAIVSISGDPCGDKLRGKKARQKFRGTSTVRPGEIFQRLESTHTVDLHFIARRRPDHGPA